MNYMYFNSHKLRYVEDIVCFKLNINETNLFGSI